MAYAALSSLMHTLEQLLQPNQCLVCRNCTEQRVTSAYQSLLALQVFLEDTIKETNDVETLKALEKRIKRVVYRAEDRVDSSLRDIILAGGMKNYERACKSFYEELLEVEKEVYLLSKELMLIEFNKHGSKSAELARTSSLGKRIVKENIVVGMKDDFNTILDRLIAQTDELTVLSIVGMGSMGKSTLARKIYEDSTIHNRFDKHAWLTISEEFNERHVLLELALFYTSLVHFLGWIHYALIHVHPRGRTCINLDELIDRNLILTSRRRANGRVRTCKIHDLLRQLCIREAQIENSVHVLNANYCISSEGIHYQQRLTLPVNINWYEFDYLLEHGSGTTSTTSSLVVMSNPSETCVYIPHFNLLNVLDVSSIYQDFSRVISELVHLRYVAANIEEVPSLAKLWNLQTIILHNSTTRDLHLPQEIWTMSEIRHLKIGWKIHMPNPLESESRSIEEQPLILNNLQTLDLFSSPFVEEILRRTPNLNKLKIRGVSSELSDFMIRIFLLECLETLHIYASGSHVNDKGKFILYYFSLAPIDLQRKFFPRNLKQLRLEGTNISWEEMVVLANLPNLEVLKAHFGFYGTDWILNEDVVFQKLKYLRLEYECPERWEIASDNFPMLEQLVLQGFTKLEIPTGIGDISTLKLIQLKYCGSSIETSAMKIQQE
ncbi:hypothetical protein P3S67_029250 [Capsicum chacoense]